MKPLILASTSPYRRALLDDLGLQYTAAAPLFEEVDPGGLTPQTLAETFARGKAASLRQEYPDSLIIGSDQVPALGESILRKPGTLEAAANQLMALSGRTHKLITAVALLDSGTGEWFEDTVVHEMEMRELTREYAEFYVSRDNTIDCAGAYKIEATGTTLFRRMEGRDHTSIIGLPIGILGNLIDAAERTWLARLGHSR